MNKEDFLNMSMNMVIEYYNRYRDPLHKSNGFVPINRDNIKLLTFSEETDSQLKTLLGVDVDPIIKYNVRYDPKINTTNGHVYAYIQYEEEKHEQKIR